MEGGDPWSMLKCAGGVNNKTIINRIMYRFRPIVPKPVNGDSASGKSMSSTKDFVVTSKRAKRKYVRVFKKNNRKRRILDEAKEENDVSKGFVTLQLMPEKADLEKSMLVERSLDADDDLDHTIVNNYDFQDPTSLFLKLKKLVAADDVAMMEFSEQTALIASSSRRITGVESWVTAENVTDTCKDEDEMENCPDVAKMKNLEMDTRPGFVSDRWNRVLWVNQAYKNMLCLDGVERAQTAIGLVVKDGFIFPRGAFSCRVRLQYRYGKGKNYSKMVPRDVWKMRSGGFAWRWPLRPLSVWDSKKETSMERSFPCFCRKFKLLCLQ